MAEALAVVGAVASIVQLVDITAKIVRRLNEFQSASEDIPNSFSALKAQLPVLQQTFEKIKTLIQTDSLTAESQAQLVSGASECLEQLELIHGIIRETLPAPDDSWSRKTKKALLSLHQERKLERAMKVLQSSINTWTLFCSTTTASESLSGSRRKEIRQWLSPPDPSLNYQKALKSRQADTGIWFIAGKQFEKWKTDPRSFMWLYGIPGCGKTVLCSAILENVLKYSAEDPGMHTAYFYFDFQDSQKQLGESMVRSLTYQLLEPCVSIPDTLSTLFSSSGPGPRHMPLDSLLDILNQIIQQYSQVYIVLDALDECSNQTDLAYILQTMKSWQVDHLHLIVTGRKEGDIGDSLPDMMEEENIVCLQSDVVDPDIFSYVRQTLDEDKSFRKWRKNPVIRNEIETVLTEKAHGMFRWAACQLDSLRKCLNQAMVRRVLNDLPETLDSTYERILCSIDPKLSEYARRILIWLAFSTRPMSIDEIAHAVAIDPDRSPGFDADEILEDPQDVLQICSSLVTMSKPEFYFITDYTREILEKQPEWSLALAHYSVKEYLLSNRIRIGPALRYSLQDSLCNDFIAKSCILYMLQFQSEENFWDQVCHASLAPYAAQRWMHHVRARRTECLSKLIVKFLSADVAYLNWLRIGDPESPNLWYDEIMDNIPPPVYYAALLGFAEIVSHFFRIGVDMNANSRCGTVLEAACKGGHENIVEMLLDTGVDVNAKGGFNSDALKIASCEGHEKIVRILLQRGAQLTTTSGHLGSALEAACWSGHETIVEMLLAKFADATATRLLYGDALHKAAGNGHLGIVRMLLAKGAPVDRNESSKREGSPLYAAVERDDERVVALLLSAGANVHKNGGMYGNALQAASHRGSVGVVDRLLKAGAKVNTQGGRYGNALQAASSEGHIKTVQLLLKSGANINAQGGYDHNALYAASRHGHIEIVEILLKNGANVNILNGQDGNALHGASRRRQNDIVELLIANGADVNLQSGSDGYAIHEASIEGYRDTIQILLNHGANINANGGEFGTALQAASLDGDKKVVDTLLARGADPNIQGGIYSTPLQAASASGHEEAVVRLLAAGANPNLEGGRHGSALNAASYKGHIHLLRLLFRHEAKVNSTTLQAALSGELKEIWRPRMYPEFRLEQATNLELLVEILLENGAIANVPDGAFEKHLQAASALGNEKLTKMLREKKNHGP